jgi:thermostable 8-oxoguanine DNA glycosylase
MEWRQLGKRQFATLHFQLHHFCCPAQDYAKKSGYQSQSSFNQQNVDSFYTKESGEEEESEALRSLEELFAQAKETDIVLSSSAVSSVYSLVRPVTVNSIGVTQLHVVTLRASVVPCGLLA